MKTQMESLLAAFACGDHTAKLPLSDFLEEAGRVVEANLLRSDKDCAVANGKIVELKHFRMPKVDNYSGNNTTMVDLGAIKVWFSYKTLIAFKVGVLPKVMCENVWGTVTGKHLNMIDRTCARVAPEEFARLWHEQVNNLN